MDNREKILALQLLLEDMRGAFPIRGWRDQRMTAAYDLATELEFTAHILSIKELGDSDEYRDGRHFRMSVEYGGYEDMDKLHGFNNITYHDKSEEFKLLMQENLEFPEYRFDDWQENQED